MTEPTPKPTDALEQMKRLAADSGWPFDGVTSEVAESWIAAWEKERAEWEDSEIAHHETIENLVAQRDSLRAALERIEGEIIVKACARCEQRWPEVDPSHPYCAEHLQWADELRAAREGGK